MTLAEDLTNANAESSRKVSLGKVAALLERNGIDVDDIGRVERVNMWQGMSKDAAGEVVVTDLVGVQLSPAWETGPAWPVVQPAAPVRTRPAKAALPRDDGWRTAVILPDPQIGYRALEDGLDPFHDEVAMAVALQIIKHLRPDDVINLGDMFDFFEWLVKFCKELVF